MFQEHQNVLLSKDVRGVHHNLAVHPTVKNTGVHPGIN